MKLLEKDIHEKQDTIISLRRQLDDIKLINLEMYKKLQVRGVLLFYIYYMCFIIFCSNFPLKFNTSRLELIYFLLLLHISYRFPQFVVKNEKHKTC